MTIQNKSHVTIDNRKYSSFKKNMYTKFAKSMENLLLDNGTHSTVSIINNGTSKYQQKIL